MMGRGLWVAAAFGAACAAFSFQAPAQAVEYVRVCDAYGANYFYSPGTETCVNAITGDTRRDTGDGTVAGTTELASRVDEIEQRINSAFSDIDRKLHAEASIAAALADPDLVAGEHFGVRVNWGNAGSANAFGVTGSAVLAEGLFGETGRMTGSAGLAFSHGTVGGRAGMQLTW